MDLELTQPDLLFGSLFMVGSCELLVKPSKRSKTSAATFIIGRLSFLVQVGGDGILGLFLVS